VDRTGHFFWPFLITGAFAWSGAAVWAFLLGPIEPVVWKISSTVMESIALKRAALGPAGATPLPLDDNL
jgi:hypothetical protein